MSRTSVAVQLEKIRKERVLLERREKALVSRANERALAKIVQLAAQYGLTATDIAEALKANKAGLTAMRKVPPKYRNPANPKETWTGRGRPPHWAKRLLEAGQLERSLIVPQQDEPARRGATAGATPAAKPLFHQPA